MKEFLPLPGAVWGIAGVALVIGTVLAVASFVLFRRQKKMNGQIVAMLLGFGATIAFGTAFFQWFTSGRGAPIVLEQDRIVSPFVTINKGDIKRIYFQENTARNPMAPPAPKGPPNFDSDKEYLLIIEQKMGNRMVLSSKTYPIRDINDALEKW